jgi:hypothetical protein
MAKYVLLEFDNDAQADALCARIDAAEESGKSFRVVGEFKKPTSFCQCGPLTEREQVEQTTRGSKFGWNTHIVCRKPRSGPQSPQNLRDPRAPHTRGPFLSLSEDGLPTPNHPMLESYQ